MWRKLTGSRPAWLVTLAIALGGGTLNAYIEGVQRISGLEHDIASLNAQRADIKADAAAEAERMRRQIARQCSEVCAK